MLNKSFTYILPLYDYIFNKIELIGINDNYVSMVSNTYLYYNNEQYFIIKLENTDLEYLDIIKRFKLSQYYIKHISKNNYTVIMFSVPNSIWGTFSKIVNGKYSNIDKKFKTIILNFNKLVFSSDFSVKVHGILYKTKNKRVELSQELGVEIPEDVELSSIINKKQETLKFN